MQAVQTALKAKKKNNSSSALYTTNYFPLNTSSNDFLDLRLIHHNKINNNKKEMDTEQDTFKI